MATRTPSRPEKSGRGMRCDALLPTPRPRRIAGPRCDATPSTKLRPNDFFREGDLFGEGVALGDSGMDGNLLRSLPPNVSPFSAEVLCGVRGDCGGAGPAARSSAGVVPSGPATAAAAAECAAAAESRADFASSPPSAWSRSAPPSAPPPSPSLASATNSHAACISALRSTPSPTTCASCAATPVTNVGKRSGSSADPGFEPLAGRSPSTSPPLGRGARPMLAPPPARSASAALAAAAAKPEGPRRSAPPSRSAPAPSSLRIAPNTGTPRTLRAMESSTRRSCAASRVLLSTTPAMASSSSNARYPLRSAATDRADCAAQSTTRRTGAPSHLAICPALPRSSSSSPSKRVSPPSTTATSASAARRETHARLYSRLNIHPSRLNEGRPVAASWRSGSSRSGPTLKPCTRRPRWRSAAIRPTAKVVLPTPACAPATTMTFIAALRRAERNRSVIRALVSD